MKPSTITLAILPTALLLAVFGCKQQAASVAQAAETAASNAEHKAQAAADARDHLRSEFDQIPLPTKSRYIDIHEPAQWSNPLLSIDATTATLHILRADANPSTLGQGGMLRPTAARSQELTISLANLPNALAALPTNAWPLGRVVAVEESPTAAPKSRPAVRRNVESAIQQLNDLGIVVDEWPAK